MTMGTPNTAAERLFELSLTLSRELSEQFVALEYRSAAQLEEESRHCEGDKTQTLRQAREICEKALEGPLSGDAQAVLAHRLLQLAIGPIS